MSPCRSHNKKANLTTPVVKLAFDYVKCTFESWRIYFLTISLSNQQSIFYRVDALANCKQLVVYTLNNTGWEKSTGQ